jgi:hypothetical protein
MRQSADGGLSGPRVRSPSRKKVADAELADITAAGVPAEVAALLPRGTSADVIAKVAEKGHELTAAAAAARATFASENPGASNESDQHAAERVGLLIRACERVLPQPLMRWLSK